MNRIALGAAVVGLAVAAGGMYWWQRSAPEPAAGTIARAPDADPAASPTAPGESPAPIEHPVEPAPAAEPLPPLEQSDGFLRQRLAAVTAAPALLELLPRERLARRLVVTVDGLTREGAPLEMRAVGAVPGQLAVEGAEEAPVLAPANGERYERHLQVLEALPPAQAARLYRESYPLLQSAYEGLGYPDRYFNDRLVAVIDHLLATPEVSGPIRLARPHVLYTYADPTLERRSAGQKAMLRLGPERATRVKAWLRAFRAEVAR
jgi:hypothetical protein